MQQLSGQDASFLYLETPNAPMHIGAITIYDQETVPGGVQGFKAILENIETRLHLARTFRQKVVRVPLSLDHPYWIEDQDFDLEFHVRHIALPAPGDWRQLCIQAARLHSRPLDLSKPLWEFTIIEGLDQVEGLPAGSYAVVSKIHHAAIDGVSGVDITEALHDLVPGGRTIEPPAQPWHGESEPGDLGLLARAWVNTAMIPFRAADVLVRTVPALSRVVEGFLDDSLHGSGPVPNTRFNRTISPHRVVEGRVFDLDDVKAIRKAVDGATINDVILAVVGGALRRYLEARQELPDASMIAMAPISVRPDTKRRTFGNQVAAMTVALGTHIPDPVQRLYYVWRNTQQSKALTNAVGAKLMTDFSRFVPSTLSGLAARLYSRLGLANRHRPVFNCVVTNVPGPQVPLYSAGARMVTQFGTGPIFDGMGLIFPVFSYCGHITVSFTSCREMVPDPQFLSECLQASFDELLAEAVPGRRGDGDRAVAMARAADKVKATAVRMGIEAPEAEVPVADVPVADMPVADVPVADMPVADVPVADVPVADVPVRDVPAADDTEDDTGSDAVGPRSLPSAG